MLLVITISALTFPLSRLTGSTTDQSVLFKKMIFSMCLEENIVEGFVLFYVQNSDKLRIVNFTIVINGVTDECIYSR